MKAILMLIFPFLFFCFSIDENQSSECEKWGGVYKTPNSYLKNQLSDSVCVSKKGNTIYQGSLNKIVIKSDNEKTTFNPGDIFAYFDGKNIYRYFETSGAMSPYGYFKIEDTCGLTIYSQKHRSYRHSSTAYYYSKDVNAPLKLLTVSNIEKDFTKKEFIDEIKEIKNLTNKSGNTFEVNIIYKKHFR